MESSVTLRGAGNIISTYAKLRSLAGNDGDSREISEEDLSAAQDQDKDVCIKTEQESVCAAENLNLIYLAQQKLDREDKTPGRFRRPDGKLARLEALSGAASLAYQLSVEGLDQDLEYLASIRKTLYSQDADARLSATRFLKSIGDTAIKSKKYKLLLIAARDKDPRVANEASAQLAEIDAWLFLPVLLPAALTRSEAEPARQALVKMGVTMIFPLYQINNTAELNPDVRTNAGRLISLIEEKTKSSMEPPLTPVTMQAKNVVELDQNLIDAYGLPGALSLTIADSTAKKSLFIRYQQQVFELDGPKGVSTLASITGILIASNEFKQKPGHDEEVPALSVDDVEPALVAPSPLDIQQIIETPPPPPIEEATNYPGNWQLWSGGSTAAAGGAALAVGLVQYFSLQSKLADARDPATPDNLAFAGLTEVEQKSGLASGLTFTGVGALAIGAGLIIWGAIDD